MKKFTSRYREWQKDVQIASPFVVVCGIIAILVLVYRVALLAYPAIIIQQNAVNAKNQSLVCGQEEGNTLQDPTRVLSASYQKRIQEKPAKSSNLITNPSFSDTDPSTPNMPLGFNKSVEPESANYQYLRDNADQQLFLRVTNTKDVNPADNQAAPGWLADPTDVAADKTYAYSFQYRNNTTLTLAIETRKGDAYTYASVVTLQPSKEWKTFTAHFDNNEQADAFRIIINGTKAGYVDTRNFDIHEIEDGSLEEGLVTIAFDDGWESVNETAFSLLQERKIRTTQYIISSVSASGVSEYMTIDQIKRLKNAGHEIGSHSLTHCNQTLLDTNALNDNAKRSKEVLEQYSLGPITTFAYPLGQYSEKTQAIYTKNYPLVRTSDFGYNDRYFDESNIHSAGILNTTSDQEFQKWLDTAKANKQWVVLVYHRVNESGEYNVSSAQLERQLDMLEKSQLKVLPISEAAAAVRD